MKLYVCWTRRQVPQPGGHPCHNAYRALRDAGHDPEVVKVYGLGVGPVKWITQGRREIKELTGQPAVPVLITDSNETIFDSRKIVEWAWSHPV
jgi:hypothetical protein